MALVDTGMVAELPSAVQRSLHRSGVVGGEVPAAVFVRQDGRIRTGADSRWFRFTAVEGFQLDPPGFGWSAALKIAGLALGRATDSLRDGQGRMHVRSLGLFTVVDATGPEMSQGALMRWLNETMWFPAVWATDVISWESIDQSSAVGSVRVGDVSVRAEFQFDDEGRLVNFLADRNRHADQRMRAGGCQRSNAGSDSCRIGVGRMCRGIAHRRSPRGSGFWRAPHRGEPQGEMRDGSRCTRR